jgi:hypothetical protein
MERIGTDARCSSHQMVQAVRKGKEGWFHVYCPSSPVCTDDGQTWGHMVIVFVYFMSLKKQNLFGNFGQYLYGYSSLSMLTKIFSYFQ